MRLFRYKVSVIWLTLCISTQLSGRAAGKSDALIDLLQEEMQREMSAWQATNLPPYFMSFRVEDKTTWQLESAFGAISTRETDHSRYFTPMVRLGNWQFDDRHPSENATFETESIMLPVEDGPEAVKQLIHLTTTTAYNTARQRLAAARAEKSIRIQQTGLEADYTQTTPQYAVETPMARHFSRQDETYWLKNLCACAALGRDDPMLQLCRAALNVRESRKYYVASDGSCIVQNQPYATLVLEVRARADDGMMLPLMKTWSAFDAEDLPKEKEVEAGMRDLIARVHRLREAPVAEPYSGPALISAGTAGVFFHEIFGHRVEGQRLRNEDDAQTFMHLLGEGILPDDVNIVMRPRTARFGKQDLSGYYLYDEEGVPSEEVMLVEQGVLRNFLMSRTPIPGISSSNGHGRAASGYDPVSRQSNLFIETRTAHTETELRRQLIEACKTQGLEYGYYFTYVNGGFTQTSRYATNAFNVNPVEVYRIYTDGRPDELVRGVDLIGTPLTMLSQVKALGDRSEVFTGTCGAESGPVPVSCIAPMVLIERIETQKQAIAQQAPPVLSIPAMNSSGSTHGQPDPVWQALEDELKRTEDSLFLTSSTRPFYTRFNLLQGTLWRTNTSFGSTLFNGAHPVQISSAEILLGDYVRNSKENLVSQAGNDIVPTPVLDNDYGAIRRQLWVRADAAYKNAIRQWQAKQSALQQLQLPEEELAVPDLTPLDSISYLQKAPYVRMNPDNQWNLQMKQISKVFADYPEIFYGSAGMEVYAGDNYSLSSEGIRVQQPMLLSAVAISASVRTDDGLTINDRINHYGLTPDELPSTGIMMEEAAGMADLLIRTSKAPRITENYSGPVLMEGAAAAGHLAQSLFASQGQGLISYRSPLRQRASAPTSTTEDRLNLRVMPAHLSVVATPYLTSFNGQQLWGSYQVDADGIMPDSTLVLVEKGILRRLLAGRTPTARVQAPTGHSRPVYTTGSISTRVLPGVVQCTSDQGLSADSLRQVFLQAVRDEGYSYGYIVRTLPGYTTEHIYRVDAVSGEEELMRSGEIGNIPFSSLRSILGVTSDLEAYNMLWNSVQTSIICPRAILFEQVGISKSNIMRTANGPSIPGPGTQ